MIFRTFGLKLLCKLGLHLRYSFVVLPTGGELRKCLICKEEETV